MAEVSADHHVPGHYWSTSMTVNFDTDGGSTTYGPFRAVEWGTLNFGVYASIKAGAGNSASLSLYPIFGFESNGSYTYMRSADLGPVESISTGNAVGAWTLGTGLVALPFGDSVVPVGPGGPWVHPALSYDAAGATGASATYRIYAWWHN